MRKFYRRIYATIFTTALALPLVLLTSLRCSAGEAISPCSEAQKKNHNEYKIAPNQSHNLTQKGENDWIMGKIVVKAPARAVWYSVHEERKSDPDLAYSKVLEQSENETTIEQKFVLIPFFGSSICVTKHVEIPFERIDYHLVKSDRFKAMEGSWVLTPSQDGKSTVLELNTHIDTGMPLPRFMVNATIARKIERRLNFVKKMAEGMNTGVLAHQAVTHY